MSDQFEEQMRALYPEVGQVVRRWANLENGLSSCLGWLLGVDQFRARVLFSSMPNFRARRELIARLGETFLDESCLPKFRGLLRRLQKLGARRNELAHCGITVEAVNQFRIIDDVFSKDVGLSFKWDKISMNEIRDLIKAIDQLAFDFHLFAAESARKVYVYSKIHRDQSKETVHEPLYGAQPQSRVPPYQIVYPDGEASPQAPY